MYLRWSYDPRDFLSIGRSFIQHIEKEDSYIQEFVARFQQATDFFVKKAREIYFGFQSLNIEKIKKYFLKKKLKT
jgi:hypothetical protein